MDIGQKISQGLSKTNGSECEISEMGSGWNPNGLVKWLVFWFSISMLLLSNYRPSGLSSKAAALGQHQ